MDCIVPGCSQPAAYELSIRMRRLSNPDHALFAPNTRAGVCTAHGNGAVLDIHYTPTGDGSVTTHVRASESVIRETSIIQAP